MGALAFLAAAIVMSLAGCLVLWYRHRSPTTVDSSIEAFRREMEALAPQDDDRDRRDEAS